MPDRLCSNHRMQERGGTQRGSFYLLLQTRIQVSRKGFSSVGMYRVMIGTATCLGGKSPDSKQTMSPKCHGSRDLEPRSRCRSRTKYKPQSPKMRRYLRLQRFGVRTLSASRFSCLALQLGPRCVALRNSWPWHVLERSRLYCWGKPSKCPSEPYNRGHPGALKQTKRKAAAAAGLNEFPSETLLLIFRSVIGRLAPLLPTGLQKRLIASQALMLEGFLHDGTWCSTGSVHEHRSRDYRLNSQAQNPETSTP